MLSLQRMIGVVGGRSGTFVLRICGTFDGTGSRATWDVVPGSSTGELRDISGTGGFESSSETTTTPSTTPSTTSPAESRCC
jgi:Protein of unknown function (DUF3224)